MVSFTKRIEIRWRDMDGFGHVNNAVYLTYLEETRDEFYTGLLGEAVHRMVTRKVEVEFLTGLSQDDDEIEVTLEVVAVGTSSVTSRETIVALSDGRVAATAGGVMVHCDETRSRSQPFPDGERRILEAQLGEEVAR